MGFASKHRPAIAELTGMDMCHITNSYVDSTNTLYFTILLSDQFSVKLDDHGNLRPDTLIHVRRYEELEELPF